MMMQQGPGIAAGNPALAAMRPASPQMGQAQGMGQAPVQRPATGAVQSPTAGGAMVPPTPGAPAPVAQRANMMMAAPQMSGGGAAAPSYGQQWQPQVMPQQSQWQMPWQSFNGGGTTPQVPQAQAPQAPQQSIMQQALAGGQSNPQQMQNFLQALQRSGAGSNNAYMSGGAQPQQQAQQLIGAPVQDNGGYGQTSYAGGFNQGMGGVSYNNGLAARPNQGGTALDPQGNQFYQGAAPQTQWSRPGPAPLPSANNPTVSMPGLSGAPQSGNPQMSVQRSNPALAAMSDERAKENVLPGAAQTREFLSHLNAWEYDYKDPRHGAGRYVSPMAQEIEKTPVGKSAIVETPEGKFVDYARLSGIQLAAAADLHKRSEDFDRRLAALESEK